jgi:cell division septation protein DedD
MKNNESGEFELVLGNRQLLSGFFIVVILFGVFFTMGYIVGRNSSPPPRAAAAEAPVPTEGRPTAASSEPQRPPAPEEAAAQPPGDSGPQPMTQPAREPEAAKPAEAAAAEIPADEPPPGQSYLQVMAVRRPEAEVVLKALKEKGFPATLGPGPNELLRVLVGPYADNAALGDAKARLESAGFHPIVRR